MALTIKLGERGYCIDLYDNSPMEITIPYKDSYYGCWEELYVELSDEKLEEIYQARKKQLAETEV